MTTEQPEAFAQLRALAARGRLRVRPDAEGWPAIPGGLGQIGYHDGRDLAGFTNRPRLYAKLWAIPGARRAPDRRRLGGARPEDCQTVTALKPEPMALKSLRGQ
jgi:hypothetical protein